MSILVKLGYGGRHCEDDASDFWQLFPRSDSNDTRLFYQFQPILSPGILPRVPLSITSVPLSRIDGTCRLLSDCQSWSWRSKSSGSGRVAIGGFINTPNAGTACRDYCRACRWSHCQRSASVVIPILHVATAQSRLDKSQNGSFNRAIPDLWSSEIPGFPPGQAVGECTIMTRQ